MNRPSSILGVLALSAIPVFAHTTTSLQEPEVEPAQEAASPETVALGSGRFVPSKGVQLMPWPRAYQGSLVLTGVEKHGSWVEEGQPVARLDRRALERQIEDAEIALDAAIFAYENAQMKLEMAHESAELSLHRSEMALESAEMELESWHEFEREYREVQQELSAMYREHGLEDAEDELNQLEAMYSDDELTDATEEIVLKRSRRNLNRSRIAAEWQERQAEYNADYEMERTSMMREMAVRDAEMKLEHAHRNHRMRMESEERGLMSAERTVDRARQRLKDLRNDASQLEMVAPKRGMLLHGSMDHAGSGSRYQVGSMLGSRQVAFSIVEPGQLEVAMTLSAEQYAEAQGGGQVVVECAAHGIKVMGEIEVDAFPNSSGYPARVKLDAELAKITPGTTATVSIIKGN